MAQCPPSASANGAPPLDSPSNPLVPLRGVRIILVDDDMDTLDLECLVLERAGARVSCVSTVQDALSEHEERPATVIISDLAMPDEDGFDLARRLREHEVPGTAVPLLALSAHASETSREEALEAGFDSFLSKPVHPKDLVAAVAGLAARSRKG
jgi:DNA-binding response OmpR family regulator